MRAGSVLFEFATAQRIIFGPKTIKAVPGAASEMGERALLVTGQTDRTGFDLNFKRLRFPVAGEPTVERVREGARFARKFRCDVVIAIGGGSAIDAGKAIAALLTNDGDVLDYLEIIGGGKALAKHPARFLAIPTTAGTGSEVTRNAVLGSPEHRLKVSLRSLLMLPRV